MCPLLKRYQKSVFADQVVEWWHITLCVLLRVEHFKANLYTERYFSWEFIESILVFYDTERSLKIARGHGAAIKCGLYVQCEPIYLTYLDYIKLYALKWSSNFRSLLRIYGCSAVNQGYDN